MSTQVKQQHNNLDLKETLIKYKSLVGLLALILVVSILSPSFLSTKNIFNIFSLHKNYYQNTYYIKNNSTQKKIRIIN